MQFDEDWQMNISIHLKIVWLLKKTFHLFGSYPRQDDRALSSNCLLYLQINLLDIHLKVRLVVYVVSRFPFTLALNILAQYAFRDS